MCALSYKKYKELNTEYFTLLLLYTIRHQIIQTYYNVSPALTKSHTIIPAIRSSINNENCCLTSPLSKTKTEVEEMRKE